MMSARSVKRTLTFVLVASLAVIMMPAMGNAASPDLVIRVDSVTAYPGQTSVEVPVYLSNYSDTIAGYNVWLQMDRPGLAQFQLSDAITVDTTYWMCIDWVPDSCIDSTLTQPDQYWDFYHIDTNWILAGSFDTSATLTSGFEYVEARSLTGLGIDMNLVALANLSPQPFGPGIAPQEGGTLITLFVDIPENPDTISGNTVNIIVTTDGMQHFGFSDPYGNSIGIVRDTVFDTTWFQCSVWAVDVCLLWEQVSGPPADSFWVDTMLVPVLDTNAVIIYDGAITVTAQPWACGDINNDGQTMDVSDLTYLVAYMFTGGPAPYWIEAADADASGIIDISDMVAWVDYLFHAGPMPACQ
jgi:hypothetical protein